MAFRNFLVLTLSLLPACAQPRPIYKITVVQHSTPAINYGHRSIATKIDFKGTPLLSEAHGDATIEYKHGATLVDARFNNVPPPSRFGAQYLTYVVWSISPEGRAQSIGELILNGSDKGRLLASTPMQTFALIVTAEPYYSVTQPSDVVVMENAIRPDTVGDVQTVNATYELLPRKEYAYDIAAATPAPTGPAMAMPEYEALVATYEARNAIQIASGAGADRYAPDSLKRAKQIYERAAQMPRKTLGPDVVAQMREAAQVAEDARAISMQRAEQDRAAQARAQATQAEQQAEQEAAAREDAARAAAEQAARDRALRDQTAREEAAHQQELQDQQAAGQRRQMPVQQQAMNRAPQQDRLIPRPPDSGRETRAALRQRLSAAGFQTLDTPRGLVVLVPNLLIQNTLEAVNNRLAAVASTLRAYPSLRVEVDGNTDNSHPETMNRQLSEAQATRVRDILVAQGVNPASISAIGYGSARPTAPNQNAIGRQQNRRVEIVISGNVIGSMPVWDRPYSLEHRAMPR